MHAFADVVEFALGNVLDAADIAATEAVDDRVEAVADVVMRSGVDLVARFGADAAVFVVTMGERNAGNLRGRNRVGCSRDGLCGALVGGNVGGHAVVKQRSAEGGVGVGIEADRGDSAHLRGMGGVAGVETEGADVSVVTSNVPRRWDGEGDTVARIVEGARRRGRRLGRGGLALQKRRYGFGFAREQACMATAHAQAESSTVRARDRGGESGVSCFHFN